MHLNTGISKKAFGLAGLAIVVFVAVCIWKFGPGLLGGNGAGGNGPQTANGERVEGPSPEEMLQVRDALQSASTYVNQEKYGETEIILESLYDKYPNVPQVLVQYYELRLFQERTEEAYEIICELLELNGGDAEQNFNAGIMANMIGRLDQSIEHLETACRIDQTNPKFSLNLAQLYLKNHQTDQAKAKLVQTTVLDDSLAVAWGTLAQIALDENKLDMALQHIDTTRTLEPNRLLWRVTEAKIHRRRNNPDEALLLLNAVRDQDRYDQSVADEIATCWALKGEPKQAAQEHIDHLNHDPNAWQSALAAAQYFHIAGDLDSARLWATHAQRLEPENEEINTLVEQLKPDDDQ